ncbi:MAG: hypothetical protein C4558_10195 [Dehalococcoidia bacterium]|nr:MAG: hypothetical protein C4558_10195 [Dehalococcoidia bacterium]
MNTNFGNTNIGFSLALVTTGAILTWAVNATVAGIDITTVGVILMVVGSVGLALSLLFWSSFAPFARRTAVVETREVVDRI